MHYPTYDRDHARTCIQYWLCGYKSRYWRHPLQQQAVVQERRASRGEGEYHIDVGNNGSPRWPRNGHGKRCLSPW